jgi:5-methylcytosine-specific restriction protein A
MPMKPKRPCGRAGCPNLTDGYYCHEHIKENARKYNRQSRDPDSNKHYGRSWKKIRAAFLSANPVCEICKDAEKLTPATTVHHKRKITDGGTNEDKNLQALCHICHSRLHAEDGSRWNRTNKT